QIVPSNEVPPDRDVHVYTLENTNAEDVAKVLLGMVARAPGPARRGRRTQGEILGTVQVLADKNTNSLVITATDEDFEILKKVIQKLDTKRRQVFVEAAILEVGLDKLRDLGTDIGAAFGYQTPDGNLTVLGGINANPADFASIGTAVPNLALSTVNVRALLHLLQSSTDTNILSTPQLLTSDNQKAEITVGQNVPFPGSQSQTVGGNVQTTIERKDVGVILRLTPQILENNLIKMDVYQEISSLVDTPQVVQNIVLGPTTNKRTANTTVIAKSEETIVIGGLIRDNIIKSESKIPLLGDIPLIGFFFRHTTRHVEKTNLLIFLTPHLVRDEKEMEALKAKRIEQMTRFMEEKKDEFYGTRSEMLRGMVNVPLQRLP
ncbi:MAG TPA: secretin N-terminal domain-containing protein, partial [Nitrospiria bacterium]|nr:secretin N-terminal domain-containing protein [Nitrospiria bacterium]